MLGLWNILCKCKTSLTTFEIFIAMKTMPGWYSETSDSNICEFSLVNVKEYAQSQ